MLTNSYFLKRASFENKILYFAGRASLYNFR